MSLRLSLDRFDRLHVSTPSMLSEGFTVCGFDLPGRPSPAAHPVWASTAPLACSMCDSALRYRIGIPDASEGRTAPSDLIDLFNRHNESEIHVHA